ncbi:MAG: carboxypeptidase regulatory-like domain-containing protein, partial [Nitrososphaerota archaeon]|nr:carboxypeptidase regulatory-like domain-containing protein [Nitrososphaerota archaeon]
MHQLTKRVLVLIASSLMLVPAALTWPQSMTGSISGVVTDPSGAVIPRTTVVATDEATDVKQTTVTDAKGFYSFPSLAVGTYDVSARHSGFQNFLERAVPIDVNSAVRVDVKLQVGAVTSTVTVQSAAAQVQTQSTQMGDVIGQHKVSSMPLDGRSFIDLLALQPGVSPYQNGATTSGAGLTPNGVSGDLTNGTQSVNGGRPSSNGFMVNGGIAEEGVHNGTALIPNVDSIAQFRIITNNFDAQYGD